MGKWKRTFLYQVLPYNHYIKGISLLVWLCFHIYELRELKWSLLFLPVCPPNIRTTQNSRVLITPGPFPVDSPSAANNETVQFRRPLGGIPCCSGCAVQVPPSPAHCPRAFALPILTVIWHSGLLKITVTWKPFPLCFHTWRWRQRDVSDEKIEHGM